MTEQQVNFIAITVFVFTLGALLAPFIPGATGFLAGVVLVLLGLATVDAWVWQSQGLTLIRSLWPKPAERVVYHEAGHFLVAHLLGIPIVDYTLSAWGSWRRGYPPAEAGVRLGAIPPELWPRCPVLWLAGVAAEELVYGQAQGGATDWQQASQLLAAFPPAERAWRLRAAQQEARQLLQKHWSAYLALVTAMRQGRSVADCLKQLNAADFEPPTPVAPA